MPQKSKPAKTRIYVAGPWVDRDQARHMATRLTEAGFEVTSRWLRDHGDSTDPLVLRREAQADWDDVKSADVLVVLNIRKSEGKATEQGLALAHGKKIIGVGLPGNNIFHHLPHYTWVNDSVGVINTLNDPNF